MYLEFRVRMEKGVVTGFQGAPYLVDSWEPRGPLVHQSPSSFISKMGRMRFVSACY